MQKLLSENCQNKLRHVDTVTVKGSSVQQKIYTYDAKVRKDFFLFGKTKSQEDVDSDRYTPAIWNFDQDLLAMRNHISEEFTDVYNRGREEYLSGNWPTAIKLLKSANLIMVQQVAEEEDGYDAGGSDRRVDVLRTLFDDDDSLIGRSRVHEVDWSVPLRPSCVGGRCEGRSKHRLVNKIRGPTHSTSYRTE